MYFRESPTMSVLPLLTRLYSHVAGLLEETIHPDVEWNHARSVFVNRLATGIAVAGDTMVTSIVRALPLQGAMKHKYKSFDRMLGEVDLVPVAAGQMEQFGRRMGKDGDWVIAVDMSDIHKQYGKSMEALAKVRDGSTGELAVPGYELITACAVDIASPRRAMPLPLLFEVFSSAAVDFVSQPHDWLSAIDRLSAATPRGTFAIDREADNGRIIGRLLDNHRNFVIRLNVGETARHLRVGADLPERVGTICGRLKRVARITATRAADTGEGSPYVADVAYTEVRLPKRKERLWLCVFDSPDHKQPMALLTTHPVESLEAATRTLARYFSRWAIEEVHRFAKQEFQLENVRTLTWHRTKNIVAAVWMVMGAVAVEGLLPGAQTVLRALELASDRVHRALQPGQFWGYAFLDGLRLAVVRSPFLLRRCSWLWRDPVVIQVPLFPRA